MTYFRDDNTEGFTANELRSMNAAHRELLADYEPDDTTIDEIVEQIGEDIINSITVTGAGGWGGAADIVAHIRGLREERRIAGEGCEAT